MRVRQPSPIPEPDRGRTLEHLQRALDVLRAEDPRRYAAIAGVLRRSPTKYQVGNERFTVSAADGRIRAAAGWRMLGANAEVAIPPRALVDVIDGATTLERLLERDILRLAADRDALLSLDDAARILARAGIESAKLQAEFGHYRDWVLTRGKENHRAEADR
jgi:hypothetical protein